MVRKKYGSFVYDKQIFDIKTVMNNCKVKSDNQIGAILKEGDLTPQRLCRFYRYHIQYYIEKTNISSYLYRKYAVSKNEKIKAICFRGAEYLDELTKEQYLFLLGTVKNLDIALSSNISARIERVWLAKQNKLEF